MAKPIVLTCYALCFMLLLLSNHEIARPVEGLKKCYSQKWRGICIKDSNCDRVCKSKEHARGGECHYDGTGRACFFHHYCKLSQAANYATGPALSLESVNDVHGRHGLSPRVFSVSHSIANNVLKEDLEDASGLLVDETADSLHASSPRKPTNGGLRDALDVVPQNLTVSFCSSLSKPLPSLSTA
ncbi:hypothetical protein V2J09_018366 [Rumex salicifolius]